MSPRFMQFPSLTAVLIIAAIACTTQVGLPSPSPVAYRPECPGDSDSLDIYVVDSIRERKQNVITFSHVVHNIPLAGQNSNVPEFHDCQRFVVKGVYDSLYAVFSSSQLSLLADSAEDSAYTPMKRGWPAAEVLSYGGIYQPLGISPYFNCLYLFRDAGRWRAKMVPYGSNEKSCKDPLTDPLAAPGKELVVRPLTVDNMQDADYPAVARWDWDPDSLEQYVGLKCGAAWCEVGDNGFGSSPDVLLEPNAMSVPGSSPAFQETHRAYQVKGWYDRQQLAVADVNGKLIPGGVWGTIFPHPVLGRSDHDLSGYFSTGWIHVATARLTDDYSTKLGLIKGDNYIYLCFGSSCSVDGSPPTCSTPTTSTWWARIDHPTGAPTYRCVTQRSHTGIFIPGTVRWRWLTTDETNWVRCTNGCCQI